MILRPFTHTGWSYGLLHHLWIEGTEAEVKKARLWVIAWMKDHQIRGQSTRTLQIRSHHSLPYYRCIVQCTKPIDPIMVKLAVGGKTG